MATSNKKMCVKCGKSGGVFTCDGCQSSFCGQHTVVHRQELAQQLDNIGQEHDLLQRDLTNNTGQYSILTRIDAWEQNAIVRIKTAADKARADLRQCREQLKTSCGQLSEELRSNRDSDNYSEIDLIQWMKTLILLKNELEKPTRIDLVQKESKDSIHLIKILQLDSRNAVIAVREQFDEVIGSATLSEDRFTTTAANACSSKSPANIRGVMVYSSGSHKVHFRIANKTRNYLFFGIMSSTHQLNDKAFGSLSTYGWWDVEYPFLKGEGPSHNPGGVIKTGDVITLALDCDHGQISYILHRTKQTEKLKVDLKSCPLPWKFLIVFSVEGDCVRLLPDPSY
jgi:hypothetical protein